ncbi:MAG: hypothetical protein JWL83_1192 [Actinomycetia bacterium]|nr:hypothetical protein [Actinomycetes bacterium]
MTTITADAVFSSRGRATLSVAPALAIAAFASIGAGAIHAAAIGVHGEHRQAVIAFTIVASVQIGWGVLALMFPSRALALAGAAASAAIFAGWVLAKTSGISFVQGLDQVEPVQLADAAAAAMAAVAVFGVSSAMLRWMRPTSIGSSALGVSALVTALITVPAMVSAGGHNHAAGHAHGATNVAAAGGHVHSAGAGPGGGASSGAGVAGGGHVHKASVVPPKPYDPTKPIDLGGVPGVTLQQQARAENLIAITLLRLPQWSDPKVAEAAGFRSIGDAVTGDEHYINLAYFDDGRILDPDHPESLVYEPDGKGGKRLAAAMFMMAPGTTLAQVPDIGGKLTQWHIHNNLCFTTDGHVAGLTSGNGSCAAPLVKGTQAPMIHVWIRPHPCGPFAALEGIGGGQIADGQARLCDTAHGA